MNMGHAALVLLILSMIVSCGYPGSSERMRERTMTIIYSGNLDGELEPCGCTAAGDMGGIKRRVNVVDRLRKEDPGLFLISAGGLLMSELPQDRLTGEYILKGLAALDYDAIGVQWKDLAFGEAFLGKERLPFVASNWKNGAFLQRRLVRHGGKTLAYFQWLDPVQDPRRMAPGREGVVTDDTAALARALHAAKQDNATTVLATTLPLEEAEGRLSLKDVNILIIRAQYEVFGEPRQSGSMLVLQPGSRGMRLGRLDLTVNNRGDIQEWRHRVIPLPKSVSDAPRMAGWYAEYNASVKAAYKKSVALRKARESGQSPYTGAQSCRTCHAREYEVWADSRHARAFSALRDVNKAFDPACIICHTVGYNKGGGFLDPEITPRLMNVQCESCHGAGRSHAVSGGKNPLPQARWPKERICAQCHTHPHSPQFAMGSYWPRIAHGR